MHIYYQGWTMELMIGMSHGIIKTGIWAGNPAHHSHTAFYMESGHRDASGVMYISGLPCEAISDGFSVSLGQEIRYFENLIEYLNQGKALTLAGSRYVLVEFGPSDSLGRMKRLCAN